MAKSSIKETRIFVINLMYSE